MPASPSSPPLEPATSLVEEEETMNLKKEMDDGDCSGLDDRVMSEVHLGCPPGTVGPYISRFTISLPPEVDPSRFNKLFKDEPSPPMSQDIDFDEDGDLILPRRSRLLSGCLSINIQHNITSTIPDVGLQVWKAELVLSDFVLHKMSTSSEFDGITALELGAGTGLVGILLARVAKTIFLTDFGDEILDNCAQNVRLNSTIFKSRDVIHVRELNWMSSWPSHDVPGSSGSPKRHSWNTPDLEEVKSASLIFAADVIYSNEITDAFFSMLKRLIRMGSKKVLYLALEKRYNFSLDDLDVVANGYAHFRSYIREEGAECEDWNMENSPGFVGKQMDIGLIPQYVESYDRGNDVELWRIEYVGTEKF